MIPTLVKLQNLYKIPVVSQVEKFVEMGLVAGYTADYEAIAVKLVDYIESIRSGKRPRDLPIQYYASNNVVNLQAASVVGVNLNEMLIKTAKIVGVGTGKKPLPNPVPMKTGTFTLGIPVKAPKPIVRGYLSEMEKKGYIKGKNLRIAEYKNVDDTTADLYLLTGNVLLENLPKMGQRRGVAAISHNKEYLEKIEKHNMALVSKASHTGIVSFIQMLLAHPQVGLLYHKSSFPEGDRRFAIMKKTFEERHIPLELFSYETDLPGLLARIPEDINALLLFQPSIPKADRRELVQWQIRQKTPIFSQRRADVEEGMLYGIYVDEEELVERLAQLSDDILSKKIEPRNLPKQYIKARQVINLDTANRMGVVLSDEAAAQMEVVSGR